MAWHSEHYPGRLALLCSPGADFQTWLDRLLLDFRAYTTCKELGTGDTFLAKLAASSCFETTVMADVAAVASSPASLTDKRDRL
eukprot:3133889-Alexandrium_andersonii.AAC.1